LKFSYFPFFVFVVVVVVGGCLDYVSTMVGSSLGFVELHPIFLVYPFLPSVGMLVVGGCWWFLGELKWFKVFWFNVLRFVVLCLLVCVVWSVPIMNFLLFCR